jgi:hypothetical protein
VQLAAERRALREAGETAGELGLTVAVENYYPELPLVRGAIYDYSVWPSELAGQIASVDHPAVGLCLDVATRPSQRTSSASTTSKSATPQPPSSATYTSTTT